MSITSDEVNYLVFRYLQESGFQHAAFTFGYESLVHKSDINGNDVPPGALISFIQKGLQYIEVEANLNADGSLDENTPSDFTLLQPDELLTKNVNELRRSIQKKKEQRSQQEKLKQKQRDELNGGKSKKSKILHKSSSNDKLSNKQLNKSEKEKEKEKSTSGGGPTPMDEDDKEDTTTHSNKGQLSSLEKEELQIPAEDVTTLRAHSSEVFIIQWSPQSSLLASGSGDSTARIWDVNQTDKDKDKGKGKADDPVCLRHTNTINTTLGGTPKETNGSNGAMNGSNSNHGEAEGAGTPGTTAAAAASKSRDVTTLDWSSNGKFLATGSYDGQARVWDTNGKLMKTLNGHRGPIFSLKWNKEGNLLLSGSVDKTAIVWDVNLNNSNPATTSASPASQSVTNSNILQQYSLHAAPTLDVDWRTNDSFATCSTDTMIYVCKLGEAAPIKTFSAHKDEVNAINWDHSGTYLASCSDDCTAKVWTLDDDKPLYNFTDHTREIYTIKWSPTSTGSANPNKPLLLASASFDATIRLWEMERGTCLYELSKHLDPVYSVAFSPCGDYLATGSFDRHLHIWSVKTGKHLKTFKGEGGIFEVCWNKDGDKVAACFSNSTVSIIDFKYHKGDTF